MLDDTQFLFDLPGARSSSTLTRSPWSQGIEEPITGAAIEHASAEHLERLRWIVGDRRRSPLQRLRAVFELGREECRAHGAVRRGVIPKLALEATRASEPVHAAVKHAYARWDALLARVLREAQEAGEIGRAHDPIRLAGVLVMLWEGATKRMQIDRSLEPLDDFLTFVFGSLLEDDPPGASRLERMGTPDSGH